MSIESTCYKNIIGFSQTECECFDDGKFDDAHISKSGFYLDELEGMNLDIIGSLNDCKDGNLWEILNWAVEEAVKRFKSDLLFRINQLAKLHVEPWHGYVGQKEVSKSLVQDNAMAGLRMRMRPIRGGVMQLKRIGTIFDANSTFTVGLYDNTSNTPIIVFTVDAVADSLKWNDLPDGEMNLAMYDAGMKYLEYHFIYPVHSAKAKNNELHCSCGNTPCFSDGSNQKFEDTSQKYNWSRWAAASGFKGETLATRSSWQTSADAMGLILDIAFICNVGETICNGELNFQGNPLAMKMAEVIRTKAGELVLGKIINTTEINRYTMQDTGTLASNAGVYLADYTNGIEELAKTFVRPENVNTYSDCYDCIPNLGFKKGRILA